MNTDFSLEDEIQWKFLAGVAAEICKNNLSEEHQALAEESTAEVEDVTYVYSIPTPSSVAHLGGFKTTGNIEYACPMPSDGGFVTVAEPGISYTGTTLDTTGAVIQSPGVLFVPRYKRKSFILIDSDIIGSEQLQNYLIQSVSLVQKHFPSVQEFSIEKEHDPETGEKWLVIDIDVAEEPDTLLNQYNNYTREWIQTAPHSISKRIRLSFNVK